MKEHQASSPAVLIAKSIVFSSGDKKISKLLNPEVVDLSMIFLESALGKWQSRFFRLLGKFKIGRWIVRIVEKFFVPGMILHYIIRKRKIEECVIDACKNGMEQLVILGGGLDTLGFRVSKTYLNIMVFEVDHPATQAIKQKAIETGLVKKPNNLYLKSANLTKIFPVQVLEELKLFSFSKKTFFLAEGVFMYLSLQEVKNSLDILKKFSKGGSEFLFSYMELNQHGMAGFEGQRKSVNKWLDTKNEPFVWGANPSNIKQFLNSNNFQLQSHFDGNYLRKRFLTTPEQQQRISAIGGNLVVASHINE